MVEVRFDTNARELSAGVRLFARTEIPFATAVALTRLAQDSVAEQRRQMPKRMKIRSKGVLRLVTLKRAEKRDHPRAFSLVGVRAEFLARHERGGIVRPTKAKRWAIPTARIKRTVKGKIRKAQRPRRLLEKKNVWGERSGPGAIRRRPRGGGGRIETLYLYRPKIRLKPRLELRKTVRQTVRRMYRRRFNEELTKAVRSRRRKISGTPRSRGR